jgi:hypothetical protein
MSKKNRHYYIKINEDGLIVGVSSLSGIVDKPDMIEVDKYDTSYLNKRYVDGNIVEVEDEL